jgi:hypothetical protein
MIWGGFIAT